MCGFVRCRKGINPDLKRGQVKRHRSLLDLLKTIGRPDGPVPAVKSLLKFTTPLGNSATPHGFLKWFARSPGQSLPAGEGESEGRERRSLFAVEPLQ